MWVHRPNDEDQPKCDARSNGNPNDSTGGEQRWPGRRRGGRRAEQRDPNAVEKEMRGIGRRHNSTNPKGRGDSKDEQDSTGTSAGHHPHYTPATPSPLLIQQSSDVERRPGWVSTPTAMARVVGLRAFSERLWWTGPSLYQAKCRLTAAA